jgi:hypothetical protein
VLVYRTPLQFTPPILNLHTVILDSQAVLTALEIAPDGAMTADERKRLAAAGALARDRGPLAAVLRQTAASDSCSGSALHSSSTTAAAAAAAGTTAAATAGATAAAAGANSMMSGSAAASASTPNFANGFANGKQSTVELGAGFDTLNAPTVVGAPARGRVRSRSFNGRARTGSAQQTSSFSPPGGQVRVPGRGVRNGRRALQGRSPLRSSSSSARSRGRSPGLLQHQQLPYRGGSAASDHAADVIDESDEENEEYGWSDVESARHRRRVSIYSLQLVCLLVCV